MPGAATRPWRPGLAAAARVPRAPGVPASLPLRFCRALAVARVPHAPGVPASLPLRFCQGACESASLSSNTHARMHACFASVRQMVSFPAHQTSRNKSCTKSSSTLLYWHHTRFHLIPVFAKKTLAGGFPGNWFPFPPHPPMSMLAVGPRAGLTFSSVFFAARCHSQASPRINIDIGGLGGRPSNPKVGRAFFFASTGINHDVCWVAPKRIFLPLGALCMHCGALSGASGGLCGQLGSLWRPSVGRLKASCGPLGRWGPSVLGAQWLCKAPGPL